VSNAGGGHALARQPDYPLAFCAFGPCSGIEPHQSAGHRRAFRRLRSRDIWQKIDRRDLRQNA